MKYAMQQITVQGKAGTFPFDMLRYDHCYPADPNAVGQLGRSRSIPDEVVEIRLRRFGEKSASWTVDRWTLFGWTVVETS